LGIQLGHAAPPRCRDIPTNDPNRRYYSETGHTVVYAFSIILMRRRAGDFGYPITEFKRKQAFVQHFQRAHGMASRLPSDKRVQGNWARFTRDDGSVPIC
jgi:hypothetical protein